MSRHKKTFAPRTSRSETQTTDNIEEQYVPISSQDTKISLAKTEVTQITYALFRTRAFNKLEKGLSIIKLLNNGSHVLALNKALNKLGYNAPENEIFFGDKTKKALMNFQKDHGIQRSGVFDRETLLRMDGELGKLKKQKNKKDNDNTSLSATSEKPKTSNSKDDDSITYTIVIEKDQKFNGKLIQTDEDLNYFAEFKMNITRHLDWKPKFTDEEVKNMVAKGASVNYKISAKENNIEKETETLSPDKKQFIRDATSTADYIQNTRILDLLKQLSDEEIADYKSKVSEETTDLNVIEESLKGYIETRNKNSKDNDELETVKTKLYGLEELYKQYIAFTKLSPTITHTSSVGTSVTYISIEYEPVKKKLTNDLIANGFKGGISEFKNIIHRYELAFRRETVQIAEDALMKYKHLIFEGKKKLFEDTFLTNLSQKIKASKAKESYEQSDKATPLFYDKFSNSDDKKFRAKMEISSANEKEKGNEAIKGLSSIIPLVEDNGFSKEDFASIENPQELRSFLENYFNDQEENIAKIITSLHVDQGLSTYGFGSLLQKSKEQQGIAKDSIFDLIITDKESEESTKHIIEGLLIGVLAVALGLLSFGTGTVAVLLAAGNFALGAYLTYEEIEAYRTQLAAYKVDISQDEPSAVWVVISVVGSVLDAAAVAKISAKLADAGRAFDLTKDADQTRKILAEAKLDTTTQDKVTKALENDLARIEALENKVQHNISKQAKIQTQQQKILSGFAKARQLTYVTIPGLVQTGELLARAVFAIRKGIVTFDSFIAELKLAKLISETGLNPEDLVLVKNAFEKAKTLAKDDKLALELEKAVADNDLAKVKSLLEERKYTGGFYNGKKPKYENPGHHDPKSTNFRGGGSKTETIPENHEELWKKAIPGFSDVKTKEEIPSVWYSIDNKGKIHQFQVDHNGNTHWAGSENGARGIKIDNTTRKRLQQYYKDLKK